MKKMEGKVVLITGGARGIGYGVAKAFAEEGANIVITGRTASTLVEARENLEADYGIEALFVVADGGDEEAVKNVVKQAAERFGRLDCLVNNAQVSKSGTMLVDHTKEDFDLAIYSGLYATFFYMREAFPYLKESRGSVINFASGAGLFGKLGQSSYAAAKEGIRGLSRVAAAEWGPFGVNVNVVCPLAMTPGLENGRTNIPSCMLRPSRASRWAASRTRKRTSGVCACFWRLRMRHMSRARRSRCREAAACAHKACPSGPHKSGRRLFCRSCGQLSARGHRDTFSIAEQ